MTIEQIRKLDQIKTKKQISVAFVLILCVGFLWNLSRMDNINLSRIDNINLSRIDNIICQIFLCIVTIIFGSFAASMMDAHYDK